MKRKLEKKQTRKRTLFYGFNDKVGDFLMDVTKGILLTNMAAFVLNKQLSLFFAVLLSVAAIGTFFAAFFFYKLHKEEEKQADDHK